MMHDKDFIVVLKNPELRGKKTLHGMRLGKIVNSYWSHDGIRLVDVRVLSHANPRCVGNVYCGYKLDLFYFRNSGATRNASPSASITQLFNES